MSKMKPRKRIALATHHSQKPALIAANAAKEAKTYTILSGLAQSA